MNPNYRLLNLTDEITTLISSAVHSIKLRILVFGPQVHTISLDERTGKLQRKRIEIREKLETLGHFVRYAEDIVDPNAGNFFFQELLLMREYDLIINIVDSPGSITEATAISMKPLLAQKAALFLDSSYINGLVGSTLQNAEDLGAYFKTYEYPSALDDCHLLGHILERVQKFQKIKYLL